jgi:hypothetical protein
LVDPSAGQIKTSCPCWESNHYTTYAIPVPVEVLEEEISLAPTGYRTPTIQPVASRCTDYATPAPEALIIKSHINLDAGVLSHIGEELIADTSLQARTLPTVTWNTWATNANILKLTNVWMTLPVNVL